MVYYLGRDVKVYITTEADEAQVSVTGDGTALSPYGVTASGGGAGSLAVAATGTITISTFTELNAGDKVNLVATDGTNYDFTCGDQSSVNGTFEATTSNIATATNLHSVINTSSGPSGTRFTATRSGAVVTVTQASEGAAGNTTITLTDSGTAGMTRTNFTSGSDGEVAAAGVFAENLDDGQPALTAIPDLTGVDLGIGAMDEDITYMGSKTVLKAEIKKETTISLTRKKTDKVWDVVYNGPTATNEGWSGTAQETGYYGARWGVIEGSADSWKINNGLIEPNSVTDTGGTNITFGYRVFIELNGDTDTVYAIPGCQLTAHTITLNADGTTEETCELVSHVTPTVTNGIDYTRLTAADM